MKKKPKMRLSYQCSICGEIFWEKPTYVKGEQICGKCAFIARMKEGTGDVESGIDTGYKDKA